MSAGLEKKISLKSIIAFTLPTMSTMVFLSLYTIIDGVFISRYVGANALSATNIVYPVINLVLGTSIMMATGGSAIVAILLGEKKEKRARSIFTSLTITVFCIGILISVIGNLLIEDIIYLAGSTEELYNDCYDYLSFTLYFVPIAILKTYFDYFLVTAGKPELGLLSGMIGGIINMVLDYVFIVLLNLGVRGAALATQMGMVIPVLIALSYFVYFSRKRGVLYFEKPIFQFHTIIKACTNGSSEMVTQISTGITTYLFNIKMLQYIGVDGVGAITIVLYSQFLLTSIILGFSSGIAPLISYNYGKNEKLNLKKLVKYGYRIIIIFCIVVFYLSEVIAPFITIIFTDKTSTLYDVTVIGFRIFAISFLFDGINIFSSALFTAFGNGKVSAFISFMRSLGFFVPIILILPLFLNVIGIWLVVPISEICTILISVYCYKIFKKQYGYG
ncbi:MATE family efflux transporter [Lachnospiraceae bacterium 46-61]